MSTTDDPVNILGSTTPGVTNRFGINGQTARIVLDGVEFYAFTKDEILNICYHDENGNIQSIKAYNPPQSSVVVVKPGPVEDGQTL